MSEPMAKDLTPADAGTGRPRRRKLGLALAGGGFRAALFHLGVLRRMAELDVLRYVGVLSTVSGGSIIGALYILLLKREQEAAPDGQLTRERYIAIVDELDRTLVGGIRKNLRLRLFLNPLGILRVLVTPHSLGLRMARLYERYLFRHVVEQLRPDADPWWLRLLRPGRMPLHELHTRPGGRAFEGGIEAYNREQVERALESARNGQGQEHVYGSPPVPASPSRERAREGERAHGTAITTIVLNSTALNSGGRFWFSASEVGDWYLGHVRQGEVGVLLDRKALLQERTTRDLRDMLDGAHALPELRESRDPRRTVALALWWRERGAAAPEGWEDLFRIAGFPGGLADTDLGLLRQAKIPAWYLREGYAADPPITGGLTEGGHWARLLDALSRADGRLAASLDAFVSPPGGGAATPGTDPQAEREARRALVLDCVLELYWIRSAERVSPRIESDLEALTLGDAVGASACFPPAFPPLVLLGIYDDVHVSRLGLTDGGVYDNIGITALLDERCDSIIASDTSGLFGLQQRSSAGRLGMTVRITQVLTGALAGIQREALRERRRVSRAIAGALGSETVWTDEDRALHDFLSARELRNLSYFHIASPAVKPPGPPPLPAGPDPMTLAALRTDLDGFGDVEVAALVNRGYDAADRYLRTYLIDYERPEWDDDAWAPRAPKALPDSGDVDRVLRVGRSRFFRALRLGAPVSWAFCLAVFAAALWATWNVRVSAGGVIRWAAGGLADLAENGITGVLPGFAEPWVESPVSLAIVLSVLALLAVLPALGLNLVELLKRRSVRLARRLAFLAKWARGLSGNVLWVFGALPAVLAAASSVLAGISYVYFHLPFMRRTRIRG